MKHRRMAWTACVMVVSSLGVAGMLAGGCGGDDTAPAAMAGAGGTGGTSTGAGGTKAGSSGTGGGMSGSAGTAGSAAGSAGAAGASGDAAVCMPAKVAPTAADTMMCSAGLNGDAAATCSTTCYCTTCPKEAMACLGDPKCLAVVQCAARTGCTDVASCGKPETCLQVLTDNAAGIGAATAFGCCGQVCTAKCPPADAGVDSATDAPKSDAATDTGSPADTGTTTDAPADTGSAADADNDGG